MSTHVLTQHLHEQSTRRLALSAEERAILEQWYEQQDQEESAALARVSPSPALAELRAQVAAIYSRLAASGRTFSDSADLLREDRDR